jgi:hypothetical protein
VTSDDLTPQQAEVLKAQASWMLRYMNRLRKRMHKRKFPETDELTRAVRDAHNALHNLNVHLHYLTVESRQTVLATSSDRYRKWSVVRRN